MVLKRRSRKKEVLLVKSCFPRRSSSSVTCVNLFPLDLSLSPTKHSSLNQVLVPVVHCLYHCLFAEMDWNLRLLLCLFCGKIKFFSNLTCGISYTKMTLPNFIKKIIQETTLRLYTYCKVNKLWIPCGLFLD